MRLTPCLIVAVVLSLTAAANAADVPAPPQQTIVLRAHGVPDVAGTDPDTLARLAIVDAFQRKYPYIKPVSTTGLEIGGQTMDTVPLMQIAGDIPAHVLYVNFRQSDTYIRNKFLYPLDKYLERDALGLAINDSHLLTNDEYVAALRRSPKYAEEFEDRVPKQTWAVMRRPCPYGADCPHVKAWGETPAQVHSHVWCFPYGTVVMALFYRKDLLHEAGLPVRAPETMEELFEWSKKLTNPREQRHGLELFLDSFGWGTLSFLYASGGRVVTQDEAENWRCAFDDEAAVDAYYYVARLFHEPFTKTIDGREQTLTNVVYMGESGGMVVKSAMKFDYVDQRFFARNDPAQWGFGPVPKGYTGRRGSEFNATMMGIYAGLETNAEVRDAAWKYIYYFDCPEARVIRADVMVQNGSGQYVQEKLLRASGHLEYVRQIPPGWTQAGQEALEAGVPEPYGRNCQQVYRYLSQAVDQIRTDDTVVAAVRRGDEAGAKDRIRAILKDRVQRSNERMLNILTPEAHRFRTRVATGVAASILVVFAIMFYFVFRIFARASPKEVDLPVGGQGGARRAGKGHWQIQRYAWCYLLLLPAVGSIALWAYYPLARGTTMAFLDYNVRGFSRWVGMENFATVLFDEEFWYALWVSLKYCLLFMTFGFAAPIVLAFLLTEVPKGKLLFRTIYYLPAVLSGVVVIFLWRSFYGEYGMINMVLNLGVGAVNWGIGLLNHLPGIDVALVAELHKKWLDDPNLALLFCLLPTIWAGMGPGCLIYLAALKTIPEDLYEAADIDGAGMWQKVFHIAIPGIKGLILINFIGVMIGTMKGGSEMVLAMTGGGPYTPYGETEVIGLHIFWQAFGYLRFGAATAMAWVLGSLLIGFTVLQLTRLSKMEFRRAGAADKV